MCASKSMCVWVCLVAKLKEEVLMCYLSGKLFYLNWRISRSVDKGNERLGWKNVVRMVLFARNK